MLHLDLYFASINKMCPKVLASSLYAILPYERFHRNALISENRGSLYIENNILRAPPLCCAKDKRGNKV